MRAAVVPTPSTSLRAVSNVAKDATLGWGRFYGWNSLMRSDGRAGVGVRSLPQNDSLRGSFFCAQDDR